MTVAEDWIGRSRAATDQITDRQLAEFRATLGAAHCAGDHAPGLEWCLSPEILPADQLGRDGHPRLGTVLPDLGLPRRMWAGGRIRARAPIPVGQPVTRTTTVRDIAYKQGRSGRLGFLTLSHSYASGDNILIDEEHDIVYREDSGPGSAATPPPAESWPEAERRRVETTPTLLFRYSALTFNAHRIHYDYVYATETEAYSGLVVHGPLQATLLLNLAAGALKTSPHRFSFRGLAPLTLPCELQLHNEGTGTSGTVWCQDQKGLRSFSAEYAAV